MSAAIFTTMNREAYQCYKSFLLMYTRRSWNKWRRSHPIESSSQNVCSDLAFTPWSGNVDCWNKLKKAMQRITTSKCAKQQLFFDKTNWFKSRTCRIYRMICKNALAPLRLIRPLNYNETNECTTSTNTQLDHPLSKDKAHQDTWILGRKIQWFLPILRRW